MKIYCKTRPLIILLLIACSPAPKVPAENTESVAKSYNADRTFDIDFEKQSHEVEVKIEEYTDMLKSERGLQTTAYSFEESNYSLFPDFTPIPDVEYKVMKDRVGFVGENFPNIIGTVVRKTATYSNYATFELYDGRRFLKENVKPKLEIASDEINFINVTTYNSKNSLEVSFLGLNFGNKNELAYEITSDRIRRVSIDQNDISIAEIIEKYKDKSDRESYGIVFSADLYKYSKRVGSSLQETSSVKIPVGASLFEFGGSTYKCEDYKTFKNDYKIMIGIMRIPY